MIGKCEESVEKIKDYL